MDLGTWFFNSLLSRSPIFQEVVGVLVSIFHVVSSFHVRSGTLGCSQQQQQEAAAWCHSEEGYMQQQQHTACTEASLIIMTSFSHLPGGQTWVLELDINAATQVSRASAK